MQLTSGSWIVALMCGNCRTNCLQSGFPIFGRSAPRLNLSAVSEVIKAGQDYIALWDRAARRRRTAAHGGSPYRLCYWVVRKRTLTGCCASWRGAAAAASPPPLLDNLKVLIPKLRPNSISTYVLLLVEVLSLRILELRWPIFNVRIWITSYHLSCLLL